MTEELLAFFKSAKNGTVENKLDMFLGISEKIMSMLFAVESQNKQLYVRIEKLEKLNKTAVPLAVAPAPAPAPSPAPTNSTMVRQSVMNELKELFEKRKQVGK